MNLNIKSLSKKEGSKDVTKKFVIPLSHIQPNPISRSFFPKIFMGVSLKNSKKMSLIMGREIQETLKHVKSKFFHYTDSIYAINVHTIDALQINFPAFLALTNFYIYLNF